MYLNYYFNPFNLHIAVHTFDYFRKKLHLRYSKRFTLFYIDVKVPYTNFTDFLVSNVETIILSDK